ncbi:hypothetical protein D3C86_1791900 [compost metagenome]
MDRANSYVAGSRHKDNCHWFFNNQELDSMTTLGGESNYGACERIKSIAKVMSFDRRKSMAIEYINNYASENKKEKSMVELNIE